MSGVPLYTGHFARFKCLDSKNQVGHKPGKARPYPGSIVQGHLARNELPPPLDHRRALDMVLLLGPQGGLSLKREVSL